MMMMLMIMIIIIIFIIIIIIISHGHYLRRLTREVDFAVSALPLGKYM